MSDKHCTLCSVIILPINFNPIYIYGSESSVEYPMYKKIFSKSTSEQRYFKSFGLSSPAISVDIIVTFGWIPKLYAQGRTISVRTHRRLARWEAVNEPLTFNQAEIQLFPVLCGRDLFKTSWPSAQSGECSLVPHITWPYFDSCLQMRICLLI